MRFKAIEASSVRYLLNLKKNSQPEIWPIVSCLLPLTRRFDLESDGKFETIILVV